MCLNLEQYRVYLSASVCRNLPVYFDLQWELVLSLSDTKSVAVAYMAVQKMEIELFNFLLDQFQR